MAEQHFRRIDSQSLNDASFKLSQAGAIVDLIFCLKAHSEPGMEALNDDTLEIALTTITVLLHEANGVLMPEGGAA